MKLKYFLIVAVVACLLLVTPTFATTTTYDVSSRAATANGPTGILVPLGLENVIPLASALMFYNWISVMLLFFIMSMASQRNMRFFGIITPVIAALFAYFGWLNSTNPAQVWGLIALTGLLGVAIYMKGSNKESFGSGGPGSALANFVFFMILLQTAVGVVNTTAIWDHNTVVTPTQYQNVDLQTQMEGMGSTGGLLQDAIATAAALVGAGIMALKMILTIILTVAAFSVTLFMVFPWLSGNPYVLAMIGAIQVIIWIMYGWFVFTLFYKPSLDPGYI